MGICFSSRNKAESSSHTGVSSKSITDGNILTSSSSKGWFGSVPPTLRSEGEILQSSNLKSFNYADLRMATRNFRPDSVLREGGFGSVFKGWIDEGTFAASKPGTGTIVAVKRLNQDGFQSHKEWLAEVNYLGQFSHPHLVKLTGYCLEYEQRLLVYEFMPHGSLENHLFRKLQCKTIRLWINKRWTYRRQKPCVQKGLGYLWVCSSRISRHRSLDCQE